MTSIEETKKLLADLGEVRVIVRQYNISHWSMHIGLAPPGRHSAIADIYLVDCIEMRGPFQNAPHRIEVRSEILRSGDEPDIVLSAGENFFVRAKRIWVSHATSQIPTEVFALSATYHLASIRAEIPGSYIVGVGTSRLPAPIEFRVDVRDGAIVTEPYFSALAAASPDLAASIADVVRAFDATRNANGA